MAKRAKKKDVDRIPTDHSRLLDAACAEREKKETHKRAAISYSAEVDKA